MDCESTEFEKDLLRLTPELRRRAMSLSRNPASADDLVQETLLKAWQHRESFARGTNLAAWLMTILRNAFLSDMRRVKRGHDFRQRMDLREEAQPGRQEDALMLKQCSRAIGALPRHQRVPLLMVGMGLADYAETAAHCGCSVGTIKSRVSRARQALEVAL